MLLKYAAAATAAVNAAEESILCPLNYNHPHLNGITIYDYVLDASQKFYHCHLYAKRELELKFLSKLTTKEKHHSLEWLLLCDCFCAVRAGHIKFQACCYCLSLFNKLKASSNLEFFNRTISFLRFAITLCAAYIFIRENCCDHIHFTDRFFLFLFYWLVLRKNGPQIL